MEIKRNSVTVKDRGDPNKTDAAFYFTIVFRGGDGEGVDALFFNSKQMDNFQWITATLTSYSRRLKEGTTIESLVKEMRETFDPSGGYQTMDYGHVKSLVHHLGEILSKYTTSELHRLIKLDGQLN